MKLKLSYVFFVLVGRLGEQSEAAQGSAPLGAKLASRIGWTGRIATTGISAEEKERVESPDCRVSKNGSVVDSKWSRRIACLMKQKCGSAPNALASLLRT